MKHLVYKTTNLVNGKYYIGVHSCNCKSCSYLGSGVALKAAIKKYGRENFKRETLREFKTSEEAFEYEKEIVQLGPRSYNLCEGGKGGNKITTPFTNSHKAKLSQALIGNTRALGFKHTIKTKSKVSEAQKGNKHSLGFKQSEETKLAKRISKGTPCIIQGIKYHSYRHAAEVLNISHHTAKRWSLVP